MNKGALLEEEGKKRKREETDPETGPETKAVKTADDNQLSSDTADSDGPRTKTTDDNGDGVVKKKTTKAATKLSSFSFGKN